MVPALPDGDSVPADGALPRAALKNVGRNGFGIYVHVPFCAARCGYCDFNTYTPQELGGAADNNGYLKAVLTEIALARRILANGELPTVQTIFFGGGTPTLLPAADLIRILTEIRETFEIAPNVEITTESNPESVDMAKLAELKQAGFTRISLGMQSASSKVLATLDRRHTPGRVAAAVREARGVGFAHINVDLIYGTPGETAEDWRSSVDAAIQAGVDHVSAYALIVEEGTRLARQVAGGLLAAPDDDVLADRYLMADALLSEAGYSWYEISNWARTEQAQCRHNMLYWQSGDWWGLGPGAHSHVGGVRWWNVKHPARYAALLVEGLTPAAGREIVDSKTQALEQLMLELRVHNGIRSAKLSEAQQAVVAGYVHDGLLTQTTVDDERVILTLRGRLLADMIVKNLAAAGE